MMIQDPMSNCCDAEAVSVNHEDATGSCTDCGDHCEVWDAGFPDWTAPGE